ncbi:MAG TPA: hypothetical protein VMZ03_05480 [Chitinophagaceae bacterium]|nr:hypothetical protein [Chitinophagaceae bacterium]
MEVHHHAHTSRKKWTHYFWEFLMLFLAVFCGFLAENKREYIVESHRAKDYAKQFVEDLRKDTAELRSGILQTAYINSSIDSLVSLNLNNDDKTVPGSFYYYSRFMSNTYRIDWNKSAINQLIQSGNLRYLKNKPLVDMINDYYTQQGTISNQNQTNIEHRNMIMQVRNRILDEKYYALFAPVDVDAEQAGQPHSRQIDSLISQRLPIQPGAKNLIHEYMNHLLDRKWRTQPLVDNYYPVAIRTAGDIIKALIIKYDLK